MAKPLNIRLDGPGLVADAAPLTREAFAPFGDVVENPQPALHPSAAAQRGTQMPPLPFDAISANQGSAIKYQHVTRMVNLYPQAPSGGPGTAVVNMFVCAARTLDRSPENADIFRVAVLERHPYTAQTFIPLSSDPSKRYLVIVAPSLPPARADQDLPVPTDGKGAKPLPGRGLPDVRRLRAFVATSDQAVTYGAGTWHSPMVALGPVNTAIDFIVVQFTSGVPIEDCQEVFLRSGSLVSPSSPGEGAVLVRLPAGPRLLKL